MPVPTPDRKSAQPGSERGYRAARVFYFFRRLTLRGLRGVWSVFNGFWLGVLSRSALEAVDDLYYTGRGDSQFSSINYKDTAYNEQGLFPWESEVIAEHFDRPGLIGLVGAGGGREVLALRRLGYTVDAWECQEEFVNSANQLLASHGFEPCVRLAPRNRIGEGSETYDGFILGWGMYTLIHTRAERVALLRTIRSRVREGAPLLVSHFVRGASTSTFRVIAATANLIRRITFRARVQVGDSLEPNLVHYFTHEELAQELAEGGFAAILHRDRPYGHTIALPRSPSAAGDSGAVDDGPTVARASV